MELPYTHKRMIMKRITALILLLAALLPAIAASPADTSTYNRAKFVWGAEIGGSIDLSGNDMPSFDISLDVGMRYRWLKFAGLGIGADIMVSNSCRVFPVYCHITTDFHTLPQLLFLDVKGGAAFNYMENNSQTTGAYAYAGLGINFARTAKFCSYMTIGYSFLQQPTDPEAIVSHSDLHLATLRLGIRF